MRFVMHVSLPVGKFNEEVRAGTAGKTMEKILADLKPEAAYFVATDSGQRCAVVIFDMKESSELPKVAEPWFLAFNAKVSVRPTMNPQDLVAAEPGFKRAIKEFGK